MDPSAILALIGDLYRQVASLTDEVNRLTKENAELRSQPPA